MSEENQEETNYPDRLKRLRVLEGESYKLDEVKKIKKLFPFILSVGALRELSTWGQWFKEKGVPFIIAVNKNNKYSLWKEQYDYDYE